MLEFNKTRKHQIFLEKMSVEELFQMKFDQSIVFLQSCLHSFSLKDSIKFNATDSFQFKSSAISFDDHKKEIWKSLQNPNLQPFDRIKVVFSFICPFVAILKPKKFTISRFQVEKYSTSDQPETEFSPIFLFGSKLLVKAIIDPIARYVDLPGNAFTIFCLLNNYFLPFQNENLQEKNISFNEIFDANCSQDEENKLLFIQKFITVRDGLMRNQEHENFVPADMKSTFSLFHKLMIENMILVFDE
jgi:hypothetical protein